MGVDIHVVTYPHGEDLSVGKAKLHRAAENRRYRPPSAGPSGEKLYLNVFMLGALCKTIWREKIDVIHAHNYEGALIGFFGKLLTGPALISQSVSLLAGGFARLRLYLPRF